MPTPSTPTRTAHCKFCAATGLEWREINTHWHLYHADGTQHLCRGRQHQNGATPTAETELVPAIPADAFDDGEDLAVVAEQTGINNADTQRAMHATLLMNSLDRIIRATPAGVDETAVRRIVAEAIAQQPSTTVNVSISVRDLPAVDDGDEPKHRLTYILRAICEARVPIMMVGPAGSGKTSAAHMVATSMGLEFYAQSVGPQTSKSDLVGYRDANGTYQRTPLRDAYEHGGIFLLDEIDAGSPAVLTILNAMLANGVMRFPDGPEIKRHADFICIAAANTFGTGADRQYVGRQQLDAATLDRFFMLEWGYDTSLERRMIGLASTPEYTLPSKSGYTPEKWLARVTQIRAAVEKHKIRHTVSPRASLYGARLLDCIPKPLLEDGLLWRGLPAIQRTQVGG